MDRHPRTVSARVVHYLLATRRIHILRSRLTFCVLRRFSSGIRRGARSASDAVLTPGSLAGLALVLSGVFVAISIHYNVGNLIPPLDDVYIHLQYARQFAEGHPFRYSDGEPITTGVSSLLYMVVLGVAYTLGFQGTTFLGFAVGFGILCFTATVVLTYQIGRRLGDRRTGIWAGVLTACSGPLLWGVTSGMEIGLVALLLVSTLLAFVREAPRHRFLITPILAVLLALVRPEGLIFAVALCGAMGWTIVTALRARRTGALRAAGWLALTLLPLVAGVGQYLFHYLATGTIAANGMQAKSWLNLPVFFPTQVAQETVINVQGFLRILSGLSTQEYVLPGGLVLFLVGLVALATGSPTWRPLAIAIGVGFATVLLAISTLFTAQWQNVRYVQPFLPVFLLLVVIGVTALGRVVPDQRTGRIAVNALLVAALVFTLAALPTWGLRLGQQAATIREAPASIGRWLDQNLPAGSVIAVNDVGATAYFSRHRTVDLVGLTTNGIAEATNNGIGSLYEELRHLPLDQRPDYFSIYEQWPGPPVIDLRSASLLAEPPLMTFDLKMPAHQVGPPPPPCQSDRTCTRVSVFRADWSLADTVDVLWEPPPGTVRDYVNVGYLASEEDHSYEPHPAQVGIQPLSMLRTVELPAGLRAVDSGRHVIGGESFTARNLIPGRPLIIQSRIDASEPLPDAVAGSRQVNVLANGRFVGVWKLPVDPKGWDETVFRIPASLVTSSQVTVELAPLHGSLSPFPDYLSFGYWFVQ